jgi:hypothetical protein
LSCNLDRMKKSFWLGRFQIELADAQLRFSDRLRPSSPRSIPSSRFDGLTGVELDLSLLRLGFIDATLSTALKDVGERQRGPADSLFWQFPCRTEWTAWRTHAELPEAPFDGYSVHVYLGMPWATLIDRQRTEGPQEDVQKENGLARVRLSGIRYALRELGAGLRVHTVCQHVYWHRLLPVWRDLGVTDAWLSHAPGKETPVDGISLHPWRLYAVNVEDPDRRAGLSIGTDPESKPLLASFVGAHTGAHLSNVRLRLKQFADHPGFHVRVNDKWHFEDVVYRHQVEGSPLESTYRIDDSVNSYNTILSDSVFSLCPSGAGPNSLRLWESLAVGSVPVLLGEPVQLPRGGTLPPIDWDSIVLRVADDQIDQLPKLLRRIPMREVRRRQQLGMTAFEMIQQQRCF